MFETLISSQLYTGGLKLSSRIISVVRHGNLPATKPHSFFNTVTTLVLININQPFRCNSILTFIHGRSISPTQFLIPFSDYCMYQHITSFKKSLLSIKSTLFHKHPVQQNMAGLTSNSKPKKKNMKKLICNVF